MFAQIIMSHAYMHDTW